jgi:hypothetical protein
MPIVRDVMIGRRPLAAVDTVRALTIDYLVTDTKRDGYRMLGPHLGPAETDRRLKGVVLAALRATPSVRQPSDTGRVRVLNRPSTAGVCPGS